MEGRGRSGVTEGGRTGEESGGRSGEDTEEEKRQMEDMRKKTALMALEGSDPTLEEWRDMGPEGSERRELAEAAEKFCRSQGAESSAMGVEEKLAQGPCWHCRNGKKECVQK